MEHSNGCYVPVEGGNVHWVCNGHSQGRVSATAPYGHRHGIVSVNTLGEAGESLPDLTGGRGLP